MSTTAPAAAPCSTTGQPLFPPEEQFWERDSPHNKCRCSGVTSTVLHVLAIGLLLLIIFVESKPKLDEETRSCRWSRFA